MIPALGMPVAVAGLLGAGLALIKRTRADVVLLSYAAAYYLLASQAWVQDPRYAVPLVVPALLLAARAAQAAFAALRLDERKLAWAVPLAILLLSCAGRAPAHRDRLHDDA